MDVVTIGESMLLFTPNSYGLLRHAKQFSTTIAGAESNVAIGLSRLGHKVGWISSLGEDEIGDHVLTFLQGEGVDVSQVRRDPSASTGIFIKERFNKSQTRVYYYRAGSAASRMNKKYLNEEYIGSAKYLHISGITPVLSDDCYEMILEAVEIAKNRKVTIVFDPNIRKKLCNETTMKDRLLTIATKADIILPGISEGAFLLNAETPEAIAEKFQKLGPSVVIVKSGEKGCYFQSESVSGYIPAFKVEKVIDPVGAGDGFAAGFLSGLLENLNLEEAVIRGNAIGAMVTMVEGDVEGLPDASLLNHFLSNSSEDVSR